MSKLQNKDIDRLFEAILTLESVEECYNFFEDACTVKELLDIAQRLKAAEMLKNSDDVKIREYEKMLKKTGIQE